MERAGRAEAGTQASGALPAAPAAGKQTLTGGLLAQLGAGEPLEPGVASRMGSAMGASFDDVRVHRDDAGGAVARAQGAQAFAIGNHIAFAPGRYQPGTPAGDELIAHELTHVVQQRGAGPSVQHKGDSGSAEHEADHVAGQVVAQLHHGGGAVSAPVQRAGVGVQRKGESEQELIPIFSGDYRLQGDHFHVELYHRAAHGPAQAPMLKVELRYDGDGDADVRFQSLPLLVPSGKSARHPRVVPDAPSDWKALTLDPFGDGSWLGRVTHTFAELAGWNPALHQHLFTITGPHDEVRHTVVIKARNAVPTTAGTAATAPVEPAPVLTREPASAAARATLRELLTDSHFGLDAKAPPWPALQHQLEQPGDAARTQSLQEALSHVRPILLALGAASHPEAYLPDIQKPALQLVADVRRGYETALAATGPIDLTAADKAFEQLWHRLTALYLQRNGGVEAVVRGGGELAHAVVDLSGVGEKPFDRLRNQLGIGVGKSGEVNALDTRRRVEDVRKEFMFGTPGSLAKVSAVVDDAQLISGLDTLLVSALIFRHLRKEIEGVVGTVVDKTPGTRNLTRVCDARIAALEGMAQPVEDALATAHTPPQRQAALQTAGRAAVGSFQALARTDDYRKDLADLQSRVKTVKLIETLGKVLSIMAIAAWTGGAAGAAVGGVLEGAGMSAGVVAAGELAAEMAAFTLASRLGNQVVFGKNDTSVTEDLVTNALMMGSLKAAARVYGKLFKLAADPKKLKMLYAAGNALTGFAALQAFAEMHAFVKTGRAMDWDDRMRSMLSNGLMMGAMSLGSSLVKFARANPELHRIAEHNSGPALHAIDAEIQALEPRLAGLREGGPAGVDAAANLVPKLQELWQRQLEVFGNAVKAEKDPTLQARARTQYQHATETFTTEVAQLELQLAAGGIDIQTGGTAHLFEPVRPGFVKFRPEARHILEDFYKKTGGHLETLPDGLLRGVDASGETFFADASKADALFEKRATGAVMGKDVYPEVTYHKDGAQHHGRLSAQKMREAVKGASKNRPSGAKLTVDTKAVTAGGVAMVLEVPTTAGAAHVDVTLTMKPRAGLSAADAHAGDAGPARLELKHAAAGKWTAKIEVAEDMRPEDVQFAIDHELNEAAELVRRYPDGEPKGGFGPEMQAGVMKRGATTSKPTAHDVASAREIVDLWNDAQNKPKDSPNRASREEVLERALEAQGLKDPLQMDAKLDLLREAGARPELIEQVRQAEVERVRSERSTAQGAQTAFSSKLVDHLLYPGEQKASSIYGGHHDSRLRTFVERHPRFALLESGTPKTVGGVTYRHYKQFVWRGTGAKPRAGTPEAPGGKAFVPANWIESKDPKTTFSDEKAFLAEAEATYRAWLNTAPKPLRDLTNTVTSKDGVVITFLFESRDAPLVLGSCFPEATWLP